MRHPLEMMLPRIRKLWALMFDAAYNNEDAIDALRNWLPQKIAAAQDSVRRFDAELISARHDTDVKRLAVDAMDTASFERAAAARRALNSAKRRAPLNDEILANLQAAYDDASRPLSDYRMSALEARRVECALKTAKTDLAKAEKLYNIFNSMAAKAGI